jgi:hypothetical protein
MAAESPCIPVTPAWTVLTILLKVNKILFFNDFCSIFSASFPEGSGLFPLRERGP